jgi:hypothetical protein
MTANVRKAMQLASNVPVEAGLGTMVNCSKGLRMRGVKGRGGEGIKKKKRMQFRKKKEHTG